MAFKFALVCYWLFAITVIKTNCDDCMHGLSYNYNCLIARVCVSECVCVCIFVCVREYASLHVCVRVRYLK